MKQWIEDQVEKNNYNAPKLSTNFNMNASKDTLKIGTTNNFITNYSLKDSCDQLSMSMLQKQNNDF